MALYRFVAFPDLGYPLQSLFLHFDLVLWRDTVFLENPRKFRQPSRTRSVEEKFLVLEESNTAKRERENQYHTQDDKTSRNHQYRGYVGIHICKCDYSSRNCQVGEAGKYVYISPRHRVL